MKYWGRRLSHGWNTSCRAKRVKHNATEPRRSRRQDGVGCEEQHRLELTFTLTIKTGGWVGKGREGGE